MTSVQPAQKYRNLDEALCAGDTAAALALHKAGGESSTYSTDTHTDLCIAGMGAAARSSQKIDNFFKFARMIRKTARLTQNQKDQMDYYAAMLVWKMEAKNVQKNCSTLARLGINLSAQQIQDTFARMAETAVFQGNLDMLKALHGAGYDLSSYRSNSKETLLHKINVGSKNVAQTVRFLLGTGIDVNAKDAMGATLLHRVARLNADQIVAGVIRSGADLLAVDKDDKRPLELARPDGQCYELLRRAEIDQARRNPFFGLSLISDQTLMRRTPFGKKGEMVEVFNLSSTPAILTVRMDPRDGTGPTQSSVKFRDKEQIRLLKARLDVLKSRTNPAKKRNPPKR